MLAEHKSIETSSEKYIAGVHIGGANSQKTALVFAKTTSNNQPIDILEVYGKIGPQGKLFSDDRIIEILQFKPPLEILMVDAPLSLPPCVSCQLPQCPGISGCEDVAVAYMQAIVERSHYNSRKRKKILNPQTQRLWDIHMNELWRLKTEPTFSANKAPLAARAITLKRRLAGVFPQLAVLETSLPHTMLFLTKNLDLPPESATLYSNFEKGPEIRHNIISTLERQQHIDISEDLKSHCTDSLENFSALITTYVSGLKILGKCQTAPDHTVEQQGWVYLPALENQADFS